MSEISASYQPQKDVLNQQIGTLDPQLQAETQGLDAAKTDAFNQITDQSNRRGLLFSGIPLAEQAQYTGANYLPAVANLKSKYAQQRFNLQNALAGLDQDAYKTALGQFNSEQSAASGGSGSASPSFGLGSLGTTSPNVLGDQTTLRQQWQKEAAAGDWHAQVALNYAGDNGRYDGPVNNQNELNILKQMGIKGNYYLRPQNTPQAGPQINSPSGSAPSLVNQLKSAFNF